MTRTGKIARLPREIRDQLNQRLNDGQPGRRLVTWLNSLPEVQQVLAANFDGRPLTEQNLSEWKAGGYLDWQARLETLDQSRELAADSRELAAATDGKLNDHLTTMLSARYAVALAEWDKQTTGTFQDKLLKTSADQNAVCTKCHAETLGPFVYEHPPLKLEGCTSCHFPHGSPNPRLLTRNNVNSLCLQCHSASMNFTAPGTPSFHNQANQYQACTNCHVMIHGSNASSVFFK